MQKKHKFLVIIIIMLLFSLTIGSIIALNGKIIAHSEKPSTKLKNTFKETSSTSIEMPTTTQTTNSIQTTSLVTTTGKPIGTTKATTSKVTKKTTAKKKTTTSTTKKQDTTTKKTTTAVNTSCTPSRQLPKGAVWYAKWGPDNPMDYFDYQDWANTVDDMKMLLDAVNEMLNNPEIAEARTDGGLIFVPCKGDAFSIYGAYIEINGYLFLFDENKKQIGEKQVSKGYVRPDGTMTWVYKNY